MTQSRTVWTTPVHCSSNVPNTVLMFVMFVKKKVWEIPEKFSPEKVQSRKSSVQRKFSAEKSSVQKKFSPEEAESRRSSAKVRSRKNSLVFHMYFREDYDIICIIICIRIKVIVQSHSSES